MPLPDPFSGWPSFQFSLQQWGGLLLQPLAPIALTTFHDADPARRRFVGTLGAAANLDAATPPGADVGVLVSGTGNVLASPPTLGAEIRWNSRNAAPGLAGLAVRGEVGLEQTVLAGAGADRPVLFFELLPDAGAGQAQSVTLGVQATQRATSTTLVLLSSAVDSPGPIRMRVGVATGTTAAHPAKNVAAGGVTTNATFLDDLGERSLADAAGNDVAAVELRVADPAGGAVNLAGQLRVEVVIPSDPSIGPTVKVSGAEGLDLDVAVLLRDATGGLRAQASAPNLPALLQVEVVPSATGMSVQWSTGTTAAPRSVRQGTLGASLELAPAAGDPVHVAATLTDLPSGIDVTVTDGSLTVRGVDGTAPSAIGAIEGTLLTGSQIPPALTDFVWIDALAASAALQVRDLQRVEATWATGAPLTASIAFGARHPLSAFITAVGLRGNAAAELLPHTATVSVDTASGAVQWAASEPVDALSLDATIVTTDEATGAGTGIVRVVGAIEGIPTGLTATVAADDVKLTFTPQAPDRVAATVQLAPPDGWVPGAAPPPLPAFDRTIDAEVTGLPDAIELRATPELAAITGGPAQLDWQASGELDYAVVALDGFALGPIAHVRARVGELPPRLGVDLDLVGLTFDVRATNQGRIGAIHVQASDEPIVPGTGAAPRRLDADIDLRGGHTAIDGTIRGLERAQIRALPIAGGTTLDVDVRFGAPGAFPGGFTASGPQLNGRLRTDDLEGTVDAAAFPDVLAAKVDLDALTFDLRLPLLELDVDVSGAVDLLGTGYEIVGDVRAPAVPNRIQAAVTRDETSGDITEISYEAAARFDDLLVELEATPAPALGMQHGRAIVSLPANMHLDLEQPRLDAAGGIDAFVRVRSSTEVPLPTTRRQGQILRVVTVPQAPSPDSLALGSFGFVEAACAKIRAFEGFRTQGAAGPAGGLRRLRGPRLQFAGPGAPERVFASIQRRLAPNRLQRLAQANLAFLRPEQIDLLLEPGPMGEIGIDFGGPLRTSGATTLGNFVVRLEPSYVGTPGGPPAGERDPAFVVPGLQIAGIGEIRGTVAAVPAHLEVALTTLGAFGTVPTPATASGNGTSIGIPAGWGGTRVDLLLDGNLAVRDIAATLYSLDWRREQRWQRITAGRVDIQPSGRTDGRTSSPRTITLHQFGLEPSVSNGGDTGTGIALSIPSSCPTNVAAVIRSAAFPRPATAAAPTNPTGAFGSPVQVDVGRLTGFLGVRVGPGLLEQLPLEVEALGSASDWRIVAATPIGAAYIGNTAIVPLSLIGSIGIAAAAVLIGDVFLGPIGWWVGLGAGILEVKYFTALEAPALAPRPNAND